MSASHQILKLWTRTESGGAMNEKSTLSLEQGKGVRGDHDHGSKRHVTILFEDDWAEAEAELGQKIDPAGRRANVYLSGGGGGAYIGTKMTLGDAQLEIMGEVRPCPIMEQAAEGLHEALKPNFRAGIWGVVLNDAEITVGDALVSA